MLQRCNHAAGAEPREFSIVGNLSAKWGELRADVQQPEQAVADGWPDTSCGTGAAKVRTFGTPGPIRRSWLRRAHGSLRGALAVGIIEAATRRFTHLTC
jgi:hypothetical protein